LRYNNLRINMYSNPIEGFAAKPQVIRQGQQMYRDPYKDYV